MGRNGRSRCSSGRRRSEGAGKKSKAPNLGTESTPGIEPGSQLSEMLLKAKRAAPPTRTALPKKTFQEEIKEEMKQFYHEMDVQAEGRSLAVDDETNVELSKILKDVGVECPRQPSEQESPRAESSHHNSDEANTTTGINGMWTNISLLVNIPLMQVVVFASSLL